MNEPPKKSGDVIVGPNTLFGAVSFVSVCATIAFLAYLFAPSHEQSPPRRLWMPVVIETNGVQTILGESRQLEFWTPSAETKNYLDKENGQIAAAEQWEAISNDDTVLQFGAALRSNPDVLGYRRVEVWGQGRTKFKPGWWWTLNVLTNYSAGDLEHAYEDYWKSPQTLFVEVIENRGSVEQ